MNDDKAAVTIARAQRAAELLENDVFVDALAGLKEELTARVFANSDQRERDRAIDLVNMLDRFRVALRVYVQNGKWEKNRIDELLMGKPPLRTGTR